MGPWGPRVIGPRAYQVRAITGDGCAGEGCPGRGPRAGPQLREHATSANEGGVTRRGAGAGVLEHTRLGRRAGADGTDAVQAGGGRDRGRSSRKGE